MPDVMKKQIDNRPLLIRKLAWINKCKHFFSLLCFFRDVALTTHSHYCHIHHCGVLVIFLPSTPTPRAPFPCQMRQRSKLIIILFGVR